MPEPKPETLEECVRDERALVRQKHAHHFTPTEEVDEHLWGRFTGDYGTTFPWELCLYCGIIRRADKKNKSCRGVTKIGLRHAAAQAALRGQEGTK